MNLNLFLIILIALIIILSLILYNGLKVILTVEKKKEIVKYQLKLTILKIPIFKRESTDENDDAKDRDNDEEEEESESKDKGLMEKYKEIKPMLKKLIESKEELREFLYHVLKTINIKKIEGNLTIGLSNPTTTLKIACWIWSIGAVVNNTNPTSLTVDPRYTEEIIDFEGKLELKINLLLLLIYSLVLLTKKNARELIIEIYKYNKLKDEKEEVEAESSNKDENKEEPETIMKEETGSAMKEKLTTN